MKLSRCVFTCDIQCIPSVQSQVSQSFHQSTLSTAFLLPPASSAFSFSSLPALSCCSPLASLHHFISSVPSPSAILFRFTFLVHPSQYSPVSLLYHACFQTLTTVSTPPLHSRPFLLRQRISYLVSTFYLLSSNFSVFPSSAKVLLIPSTFRPHISLNLLLFPPLSTRFLLRFAFIHTLLDLFSFPLRPRRPSLAHQQRMTKSRLKRPSGKWEKDTRGSSFLTYLMYSLGYYGEREGQDTRLGG